MTGFRYDEEIRTTPSGEHTWDGRVHAAWNIGTNPNGGYLLSLAADALRQACPGHPDPLSITVHYLRPGVPDTDCRIRTQRLRAGRTLSTARATLEQQGEARIEVLAAMGDLAGADQPVLVPPPPVLPPPEQCEPRTGEAQSLMLPILQRLDIRLAPEEAVPGKAGRPQVTGWIRFRDGREPDPMACLLFADTFPPSVMGLLGNVGWVPTVELTVQVRHRPAPGWMLGQFRTLDFSDGRIIEDGALWDSTGRLVAQARQLALVRQAERKS
ncbi:MAG: thioesterase family protein [Betaproteobacteria bacterium]|nr:thioesterase family protein [Betaproteobacteria bacterium]